MDICLKICYVPWLIFLIGYFSAINSLKILDVRIPVYKLRGEEAELSCSYDLGKDILYSIKWYKDDDEFYRFMPNNYPQQMPFSRPGIKVQASRSNASHVVLSDLDFKSSGLYRCEISVEKLFNTLNRNGRMLVVELPTEGPKIRGVKEKYEVGDLLKANCSSAKSHPAARLSWEISNRKVPNQYTYKHPPITHLDGLETSILSLRIPVIKEHFVNGMLRLRCVATVAAATHSSSEQDFEEVNWMMNKPIVLEQRDHLISVSGGPWMQPEFFLLFVSLNLVNKFHS